MRVAAAIAVGITCWARALAAGTPPAPNTLTAEEQKAGWRLLFDGKTAAGWRGFKSAAFPSGRWTVADGCLKTNAIKAGVDQPGFQDIVTTERFTDFELSVDWRVSPGGNSGVKYLVTEERSGPIAHEYQVLDDERHPDAKVGPHRQAAAFFDVLPPSAERSVRPAGEWNRSRVVVKGDQVEHWINGKKALEYRLDSPELKAAIARSKFKDVAGFGTKLTGHILLQDHGDEVWFRDVKIRALKP